MLTWLKWSASRRYARNLRKIPKDSSPERPPYLLIDVSVLRRSDARTGIQRAVRAILFALSDMRRDDMLVQPVFATRRNAYSYCSMPLDIGGETPRSDGFVVPQRGDIFLGLDLAIHLLPIHERQIADWKGSGVSVFLMVYDLLPLGDPRWFTAKLRRRFHRWLGVVARHADGAICISNAVAKELSEYLRRLRKCGTLLKIWNVQLGSDIMNSLPDQGLPQSADALLSRIKAERTVLMVGTVEPRKAYDKALAAFERLWSEHGDAAPRLVIVGRPGWKTDKLQQQLRQHSEAGRKLRWLSDVSDEFLDKLYDAATAVLMTSQAEGCGLPVLEALAHHRPVLVRDIPVFREQKTAAMAFFQDDHPHALGTSIMEFLDHMEIKGEEAFNENHPLWADTATSILNIVAQHDANA